MAPPAPPLPHTELDFNDPRAAFKVRFLGICALASCHGYVNGNAERVWRWLAPVLACSQPRWLRQYILRPGFWRLRSQASPLPCCSQLCAVNPVPPHLSSPAGQVHAGHHALAARLLLLQDTAAGGELMCLFPGRAAAACAPYVARFLKARSSLLTAWVWLSASGTTWHNTSCTSLALVHVEHVPRPCRVRPATCYAAAGCLPCPCTHHACRALSRLSNRRTLTRCWPGARRCLVPRSPTRSSGTPSTSRRVSMDLIGRVLIWFLGSA